MTVRDLQFKGAAYKIWCVETISQHPTWFSFEDEASVRDSMWDVKPGDVVLDVGAAYGSYALTALASGADFVHAWSPQGFSGEETEAEVLKKSLDLNGWSDRCSVRGDGAYSRVGWLNADTQEFTESEPSPMGANVIKVQTLDGWASGEDLTRVDWMKLDVEGAEVDVLKGADGIVRRFRPKILVENHLFKRATIADEVRGLLIPSGYREVATVPYHSVSHSLYVPA